jgi:hypothetical protein
MAIAPRDDRRHERFEAVGQVELRIVYTQAADVRAVKARLHDLGMGGLMAETSEEVPPGVLADLDIRLEGKELQNTLGLVRWSAPGRGVGIEFFYATDEEKAALERYIADWLAARERRARRD